MKEDISKIEMAEALASFAHKGQKDKAGKPYIYHPLAVKERVEGEKEKITALLHDVIEDTFITLETVRNIFGDEIAEAVDAMTHKEGEDYFEYVERLSHNPISRRVKLADLSHNMDLSRIPNVTERDLQRLEKYKKAEKFLLEKEGK